MEARLVEVVSPLAGTVLSIERGVGHRVTTRSAVATLEAEQTRVAVEAGVPGVVDEVRAVVGTAVQPGDVLVVVAAADAPTLVAVDLQDDVSDSGPEDEMRDAPPAPAISCTHCGAEQVDLGFIPDRGGGMEGYVTWVEGALELGLFGPRRLGRRRYAVEAYRCRRCSHLEFFAPEEL